MCTQQRLCDWLRVQDYDAGENSLKQVVNPASLWSIVCGHALPVQPWHMHHSGSLFQTDLPLHQELLWLLSGAVQYKSFALC